MFDGEASWFLIVIFVLWVLETIAKARQRSKLPDQQGDGDQAGSAPTTLEAPTESRPRPQGQPRTLWEEIAEIARQQQRRELPPDQRLPDGGERPTTQRREVPTELPERAPMPRRRTELPTAEVPRRTSASRGPQHRRPPAGTERTATTRWEGAAAEETVFRGAPLEAPPGDERRSDRWLAGRAEEGASTEGAATYDTAEARPRSLEVAPRPRSEAAVPARTAVGSRDQGKRAERRPRKGSRAERAELPELTPLAGAPEATAGRIDADVHHLRSASRAELRRILILQEVLGPPVALREGPLAED